MGKKGSKQYVELRIFIRISQLPKVKGSNYGLITENLIVVKIVRSKAIFVVAFGLIY